MPITFEEVTGEIQREPATASPGDTRPARAEHAEDLHEQLERELRLMAERAARLCAD
jgi:hypothetical protein